MIEVVRGDITRLQVDAIVNAANPALAGGGGVDGAIHRAAGPRLVEASRRLAPCPPGSAVVTPGFDLPARFVIHAVGPIWRGGDEGEDELLRLTYESVFRIASDHAEISSVALPAISTGVYGFPRNAAARIAVAEMRRWTDDLERIVACAFDAETHELYLRYLRALAAEGTEAG